MVVGLLGVITAVLTVVAVSSGSVTSSISGIVILGIAAMIIGIALFIINLVGIIQAMKDEGSFKVALVFVIVGVIASILGGIFTTDQTLNSIIGIIESLSTLLVMVFIIQGIQNLAVRLGNEEVLNSGKRIFVLIIVIQGLALIASIIAAIFSSSQAANITAVILLLISSVIGLIATIMYLVFLGKAKNMLAEGK